MLMTSPFWCSWKHYLECPGSIWPDSEKLSGINYKKECKNSRVISINSKVLALE